MENNKEKNINQVVTLKTNGQFQDKDVFNNVVEVIRENFIATFNRESDISLIMRFVGGRRFRIAIEEVPAEG